MSSCLSLSVFDCRRTFSLRAKQHVDGLEKRRLSVPSKCHQLSNDDKNRVGMTFVIINNHNSNVRDTAEGLAEPQHADEDAFSTSVPSPSEIFVHLLPLKSIESCLHLLILRFESSKNLFTFYAQ